ncbi:uncharacterized protein LOC113291577 [Papaver somniferum]|uniref:uncharacterized protein LOC113291577 n=1 Tax=Papaver somniferum TaxID=3469 RepID=UPI000E705E1E|nr:uncharacterized protein LOC113291577 [Papaver somniferum]
MKNQWGQELSEPNTNDIEQDEEPSGEELSLSDTNEIVQNEVEHEEYGPANIYDPGNWGTNINRSLRDILIQKKVTIEKEMQEQIKKEKDYWNQVLIRIVSLVKTLAKNNFAFRGDVDKIGEAHNGNFLSFIEMIAEFDLIQEAMYFSVILDCTSDKSHEEQMSVVIRCVDVSSTPTKVEEFFLGYLKVEETTGEGIFEELKSFFLKLNLNIDDIRGHGYDNGSNMSGKKKGVQNRLLEVYQDKVGGLTVKALSDTR